MLLAVALRQVSPGGHVGVVRPSGTILHVNRRMAIRRLLPRGPVDWRATFADLVADDWELFDLNALREEPEFA